jgi:hypothetical protein
VSVDEKWAYLESQKKDGGERVPKVVPMTRGAVSASGGSIRLLFMHRPAKYSSHLREVNTIDLVEQ